MSFVGRLITVDSRSVRITEEEPYLQIQRVAPITTGAKL